MSSCQLPLDIHRRAVAPYPGGVRWLLPMLLISCATPENKPDPPARFLYIQDSHFEVENPSRDMASVTGTGCGATQKYARLTAEKVATFNIYGVTGNARYKIRYDFVRAFPQKGMICVEVKATAITGF